MDVGDGARKIVEREEIIPLEEFRKLAEKAKAPCDKHGDGDCDCGKPVGQRQADITAARQAQESAAAEKPGRKPARRSRGKSSGESRNQKRSRGRRRGRRSDRKAAPRNGENEEPQDG